MKRLPTLLITCIALNLTSLTICEAGHRSRLCRPRICSQPAARVCSVQPDCQPMSVALPDDLNILMTAEIASLREEVEQLKLANAELDKALEESQELARAQEEKSKQQLEQLAAANLRVKQAEAKAIEQGKKFEKETQALKDNLAKARQNNKGLRKQLDTSKQALTEATAALKAEQEKDQKEQPRPEEKAIQTPPAKEETSAPPEEPDSDTAASSDDNADKAAEKVETAEGNDVKATDE